MTALLQEPTLVEGATRVVMDCQGIGTGGGNGVTNFASQDELANMTDKRKDRLSSCKNERCARPAISLE